MVLKPGDVIRFRGDKDEEWSKALVHSRGGKSSSALNKHRFNLKMDGEDTPVCVDLKKQMVEKWNQEQQNILFMEEDQEIFVVSTNNLKNDPRIIEAKEAEINKFKEFGVYEEVKDLGQSTISSRWIVTTSKDKIKARLVARGFQMFSDLTHPQSTRQVSDS